MISLALMLALQAEPLKELEFLVGRWTGSGSFPDGKAYEEEHRFEWIQDRNFLKAEYALKVGDRDVYGATSIIGYDAARKKLVAFAFGRNGAIARSEQAAGGKKDVWVFEGAVSSPQGSAEDRVTQTRIDADTFTSAVETKKDGAWVAVGTYTYRRKK